MDAKQASQYKVLSSYLEKNIQSDIMGSQKIMNGMYKYSTGNLTKSEIKKATTWGSGPNVKIVDNVGGPDGGGADGSYNYSTNTISISTEVAKQLENAKPEDIQAILQGVFILMGHETVHYGDYLDGVRSDPDDPSISFGKEPGEAFEGDVFTDFNVTSEGETYRVKDPVYDVKDIDMNKKLINRYKAEGNTDLIPTVPEVKK